MRQMNYWIDDGWLWPARRLPSPNCDARPQGCCIDLAVIHGISLPPRRYGGGAIDALFTNALDPNSHEYFRAIAALRVSAHLLIRRDGDMMQYVPFDLRAWHAGESEFEGRRACNDFSVGIELEGCDEDPYEAIQYERLADVLHQLMIRYPGITPARIVGHCHIAPGRKTDPGPQFEWDRLYTLLHIGSDNRGGR